MEEQGIESEIDRPHQLLFVVRLFHDLCFAWTRTPFLKVLVGKDGAVVLQLFDIAPLHILHLKIRTIQTHELAQKINTSLLSEFI